MKISFLIITLLISNFCYCQTQEKIVDKKQNYLRWVGDIEQNNKLDDPNFKVCNGDDKVLQYFNLEKGLVFSGEKSTIIKTFQTKYKPIFDTNQNGFIRVRFIVNCEGKAGRFRILQSNINFQETEFNKEIVSQILNITKGFENWAVLKNSEIPVDYYLYLTFKITDGHITEILP